MLMEQTTFSSKAWYLVYTKVRQEYIAQEHLQRQGYATFLPQLRETRRKKRSLVKCIEPLFPRYLFIRLDSVLDNWAPIRSTTGVAKMVRFGDMPLPVPQSLIDTIQSRCDEPGVVDIPEHKFQIGERVRIVDGPMSGYEAIFNAPDSNQRVILLLDVVGKQTPVRMPASFIEVLS